MLALFQAINFRTNNNRLREAVTDNKFYIFLKLQLLTLHITFAYCHSHKSLNHQFFSLNGLLKTKKLPK